jgi:DNA replication protein DnaD
MPPEVILLLLNYCDAETHRLWGNSRRPTARKISEEAYYWARREIMSIELAEEYIAGRERQREDKHRILELLGIRGREPSPSEGKYLDAWLEMGFSDEAIALAFDRTLTNTGALKWPYLNGILKKWHAAGLHELGQIEAAEGSRRKSGAPRGRGYGDPVDESALADFMGDKA